MGQEHDDRLIFTFATGPKKYITTAKALAMSLKLQRNPVALGLMTDSDDPDLKNYFDVIVRPPAGYHHWFIKLAAMDAFPAQYKKFIFIDSDSLVLKPLDTVWETFGGSDFAVSCYWKTEADAGMDWYGDCVGVAKKLGIERFATFNAGFMYYERSENTKTLFKRALEFREQADSLGLKRNMGEIGDDICISFAWATTGIGSGFSPDLNFSVTPWYLHGGVHLDVLKGECTMIKGMKDPSIFRPLIYHSAHTKWDLKYWREVTRLMKLAEAAKNPKDALLRFRKPMIVLTNWYMKLRGY